MSTTGAKYPTLGQTISESPWSDNTWSYPTRIYADDGSSAYITASTYDTGDQSRVLKATGFDFSAIPDGATINGVIVRVNTWYANGTVSIDLAQLLNTSKARVGDNKYATPEALSTSNSSIKTIGGDSDTWGNALTPDWVKNANFGVGLGFLATGNNADVYVDYVTIEIYYTYEGPVYDGILKRWNGSAWVKEPLKVYLDSSWQAKPLKRYTGSEWVTVDTTGV